MYNKIMNSNQGVSKEEVQKFSEIYEDEDNSEIPPELEDMSDKLPIKEDVM